MFIFNRSFLALTRAFLFGLICLAVALWFLYVILITQSNNAFLELKINDENVSNEVSFIDEAVSDSVVERVNKEVSDSVVSENEPEIDEKNEPDFSYENINNDTMIFAAAVLRHGDCDISLPGQPLTVEGEKQVYEVGQFLRRRYNKLLGDYGYSNDKIYMLATDTDRAIMSAQVHLAAMFPPTDENRWNDKIWWHPIPLHTLPNEMDIFFRGGKPCPKYDERYNYYMQESPRAKRIWKKYRDLIQFWETRSGWNLSTIEDVANLHRAIEHKQEKHPLKVWEEAAMRPGGPMDYVRNFVTKLRGIPELVRRRAGFLIKEILYYSYLKTSGNLYPDRVLYLYSCHSSTILPILNGFGIFELTLPPYASSLHFEVYKNDQDEHYYQFFYRKPDEEHPLPLNIPGCGEKWTLEEFFLSMANLFQGVSNLNVNCDNNFNTNFKTKTIRTIH